MPFKLINDAVNVSLIPEVQQHSISAMLEVLLQNSACNHFERADVVTRYLLYLRELNGMTCSLLLARLSYVNISPVYIAPDAIIELGSVGEALLCLPLLDDRVLSVIKAVSDKYSFSYKRFVRAPEFGELSYRSV